MKSEILRSLLVDRELGELTPDVVELLEAYLTAVPEAQSEVNAITRTVETARETVRRFPELAVTPVTTATLRTEVIRHWFAPSLAYAAALIAVAGIAAWLGFHAGASKTGTGRVTVAARAPDHRFEGLWTQYQVVYDSGRATFAVTQQP
jgi:anti-sigma factor RsiW